MKKVIHNNKLAIDGGLPVRENMLLFGEPAFNQEEYDEVLDTLRSRWIGTGPKTHKFEIEFAKYVGAAHAIAVSSCTAALHLGLIVSGIGEGDEVITSPLTFAATANVIIHQKARPVFADVDPHTLNIDPKEIERAKSPRTKAIIPVHFGGLSCEMDEIERIANQNGLVIIEDAAHAVGTRNNGKMVGGRGNLACFSFYANKNLTTGEGGMIVTDDKTQADKITMWHLHGLNRDAWKRFQAQHIILSEAVYPGYKYNMTDIQASLGIHQLRKQEEFLLLRENYAQMYDDAFSEIHGVRIQHRPKDQLSRHSLHLYVLILDPNQFLVDRNQIVNALLAENIGAAVHYSALHTHPYYRDTFGFQPDDFPHAENIGDNIFTLPLTPGMNEKDVNEVIEAVNKVLTAFRV